MSLLTTASQSTETSRGRQRSTRQRRNKRRDNIVAQNRGIGNVTKQQVRDIVRTMTASRMEHKYFTTGFSSGIGTGNIQSLTDVPQGDTDLTRDGDALIPLRLDVAFNVVAGDNTNLMRVIIFRWHASSTPAISAIIQGPGAVDSPLSPTTHDTRSEYTIYYDRLFNLVLDSSVEQQVEMCTLNLPRKEMRFQAAGTTGTDKIYLIVLSDSLAAPFPSFQGYFKFWFTDA